MKKMRGVLVRVTLEWASMGEAAQAAVQGAVPDSQVCGCGADVQSGRQASPGMASITVMPGKIHLRCSAILCL